jgi:hypothetical protein
LRQSRALRRKLKRRQSIEPVIGHLKHDHRMNRCHLKGRLGDQLNALGAALGFNLRKLLAGLRQRPCCAAWGWLMQTWITSICRSWTRSTPLVLG